MKGGSTVRRLTGRSLHIPRTAANKKRISFGRFKWNQPRADRREWLNESVGGILE
jgi:hypothetical protein